jgi:hypothetical protein
LGNIFLLKNKKREEKREKKKKQNFSEKKLKSFTNGENNYKKCKTQKKPHTSTN